MGEWVQGLKCNFFGKTVKTIICNKCSKSIDHWKKLFKECVILTACRSVINEFSIKS